MKVSVIVPVYNDEYRIIKCIEALKKQTLDAADYEIIIINNASNDNTQNILNSIEGIIKLDCPVPGSYAARNMGINSAKGEYLAFTDSDCIPDPDWLRQMLSSTLNALPNTIVAGQVDFFIDAEKNTEQEALLFERHFSMDQSKNVENGQCITANLLCEKELFDRVGPFNQQLKSGGDVDFTKRVSQSIGQIILNPNAVVRHPSRNTAELILKRRRVIGGSWDKSFKSKHFRGLLTLSWRALKQLMERTLTLLTESSLPLTMKWKVEVLLLKLFFISVAESFKLALGKESSRV
ncbi:glycosyltransferase [Flavobacterium sp. W21_SRS_FM6]|uniref:glycosyltransferase n=1 Tax=Flavobacterium sp. W21_SRS_FM6 TaxID=3240268 RepID=UPI003F9048A2